MAALVPYGTSSLECEEGLGQGRNFHSEHVTFTENVENMNIAQLRTHIAQVKVRSCCGFTVSQ